MELFTWVLIFLMILVVVALLVKLPVTGSGELGDEDYLMAHGGDLEEGEEEFEEDF